MLIFAITIKDCKKINLIMINCQNHFQKIIEMVVLESSIPLNLSIFIMNVSTITSDPQLPNKRESKK